MNQMLDRTNAPAVRPFGHLALSPENCIVLSNGIVLHTLYGGDQDVIRFDLIAEGGPTDNSNPCIPAFAAELLREGNSKLGSEAIADIIDYNGAWFNSAASGHFTTMQLSALSSKLMILGPIVIDSFIDPAFPNHEFEIIKNKGVARQQLNLSRVNFLASADNRRMIAGAKHPESLTPSPELIQSINIDDLKKFHRQIVNGNHIHAYLCGHFSDDDVNMLIKKLETIPSSDSLSPMKIVPFVAEAPGTSIVRKDGSLQTAVAMSIPAISRNHPHYNALRMTVTALGGYFGSRLMSNIREDKGYTYGISASLMGSREGSYTFIAAQCDPRYTDALIDEVRMELIGMVNNPLDNDEFRRLKFNVGSDLASTLDTPMTMMDYYELRQSVGIPDDYFDARQKTLASITPEVICEMARLYLRPEELRISIAGPQ